LAQLTDISRTAGNSGKAAGFFIAAFSFLPDQV